MAHKNRGFIGWLLLFICLPYLLSSYSLIIDIARCNPESVECWSYKRIFVFAILYSLLGLASTWFVFAKSAYWRVTVWFFLAISTVLVLYDFYRSPGQSIWEVMQIKVAVLRIFIDRGDVVNLMFWIGKDFLNPILLLLTFVLMFRIKSD